MASVTSVLVWWLPENPQAFEASKLVSFFAKIRLVAYTLWMCPAKLMFHIWSQKSK